MTLQDSLFQPDTGSVSRPLVLLGAGASVEAGLPTAAQLDTILMSSDLPLYSAVARAIGAVGDPERTIRALVVIADDGATSLGSDLRRTGAIAPSTLAVPPGGARAEINAVLGIVRPLLWLRTDVDALQQSTAAASYLAPLVSHQAGATIVTLNYDNTVELADRSGIVRVSSGRFEIDVPAESPGTVRLLKLHGSLDWAMREGKVFRVSYPNGPFAYDPAIILGASGKLRSNGPFPSLYAEFQRKLNESDSIVSLGYSFRDEHVNDRIRAWARTEVGRSRRLSACLGPSPAHVPDFIEELGALGVVALEVLSTTASEAVRLLFPHVETDVEGRPSRRRTRTPGPPRLF